MPRTSTRCAAPFVVGALLALAEPALAHGLDAGRVTLELDEASVRIVATPLARSFQGLDDDGDGLADLDEVRVHRPELRAAFERAFVVTDGEGREPTCERTDVSTPGSGQVAPEGPIQSDHVRVTRLCTFATTPSVLRVRDAFAGDAPVVVDAMRLRSTSGGLKEITGPVERVVLGSAETTARLLDTGAAVAPSTDPDTQDVGATSARGFITLGFEHVALGLGHLLFLAALVLGARALGALLAAVSAFTLTHTLALVLVVTGLVPAPSSRWIEPIIALSIALAAASEVRGAPSAKRTRRGVALGAAFGLVHGLGLASSALASFQGAAGAMLVPFTFGAELAQLSFASLGFALVGAAFGGERRRVAAVVLTGVGLVWFALRLGGAAA